MTSAPTVRFDIFLAGDLAQAKQVCREYCFDVAIAQVRALVKNALLAQRIEHEPSKLGVEGSNPSERTNEVRAPRPKISPPSDPIYCNLDEAKWCRCVVRCDDCPTLALTRPHLSTPEKSDG